MDKAQRRREIQQEIDRLNGEIASILAEDRTDFAQGLMDKMFAEFSKGAAWLERMKKNAISSQHVYGPQGRIRHLYATLIHDERVRARQLRRGINAPIQGLGSEQGMEANRAIDKTLYMETPVICSMLGIDEHDLNQIGINRVVHDASYFTIDYEMVLPTIHIVQHEATYGSADRFRKYFGIDFIMEPEIEMAISARADKTHTWDWTLNNLIDGIWNSIVEAEELGILVGTKPKVLQQILQPWINKECREYLCSKYPILGVPEVVNKIPEVLKYARTKISNTK